LNLWIYLINVSVTLKGVRLGNPPGNAWNKSNTKATISGDGLQANSSVEREYEFVYAEKGFGIHWKYSRKVNFPGTILYYFEITQMSFAADG
jgi:hypothetical protein